MLVFINYTKLLWQNFFQEGIKEFNCSRYTLGAGAAECESCRLGQGRTALTAGRTNRTDVGGFRIVVGKRAAAYGLGAAPVQVSGTARQDNNFRICVY